MALNGQIFQNILNILDQYQIINQYLAANTKSKIVAYKYSSLNHHWENITVNFFLLKRMNFIILLTFINYYKVLLLLYKGPLAKAFFG